MEKYYATFLETGKLNDVQELFLFTLNSDENVEGRGYLIQDILTMTAKEKIKPILDKLVSDSTNLEKLKSLLDEYSDRHKIYGAIGNISPTLFEKIKETLGEEEAHKADINRDLGDLGF